MFFSILSTLLLGTIIGSIVSVSVYGFLALIELFSSILDNLNENNSPIEGFINNPIRSFTLYIIVPSSIGLLVGYLRSFTNDKRWHGPPDVILSAHSKNLQ